MDDGLLHDNPPFYRYEASKDPMSDIRLIRIDYDTATKFVRCIIRTYTLDQSQAIRKLLCPLLMTSKHCAKGHNISPRSGLSKKIYILAKLKGRIEASTLCSALLRPLGSAETRNNNVNLPDLNTVLLCTTPFLEKALCLLKYSLSASCESHSGG